MAVLDITKQQYQAAGKSRGGLFLHLGFFAFAIWILGYPKIALLYSVSVYQALPLPHLPFILTFVVFGLLAGARKLKFTGISTVLSSLASVVAGLAFVFLDTAVARLVSFSAIAVLAAYALVAWGSILRDMTPEELFSLMAKSLLAVGGFTLICALPYLASGYTSPHSHYLFVLLLLAVLPLCSGLYLLARKTGAQSCRSDCTEPPQLAWRRSGLLPFAIVLFAAAALTAGIDGYSYRPTMIDSVQLDSWQGLLELCLAALALLAWGLSRGGLLAKGISRGISRGGLLAKGISRGISRGGLLAKRQYIGFSGFVAAAFLAMLLLTVFALLLAFLGLGRLAFTQALFGAMGNSFFLALLFFCGYSGGGGAGGGGGDVGGEGDGDRGEGVGGDAGGVPNGGGEGDGDPDVGSDADGDRGDSGSSSRDGFFVRLLVAILCSGFYWAPALGTTIQKLIGYDNSILAFASASSIIVISALAIVAMAVRPVNRLGASVGSKDGGDQSVQSNQDEQDSQTEVAVATTAAAASAPQQQGSLSGSVAAATAGAAGAAATAAATAGPIGNDEFHALVKSSIIEWRRQSLAPYQLSNREFQLACMLLEGFTSPAIAEDLGISVNTVKGYMKTMYRKCGVISKAELIRLATSDTKDV